MTDETEYEYTFKTHFLERLGLHQKQIRNNEQIDYSYDSIDATNYKVHAGLFLRLPSTEEEDLFFLRDVNRLRLKHVADGTELTVWYYDGHMPGYWQIHYFRDELYLLGEALFCMYDGDP